MLFLLLLVLVLVLMLVLLLVLMLVWLSAFSLLRLALLVLLLPPRRLLLRPLPPVAVAWCVAFLASLCLHVCG